MISEQHMQVTVLGTRGSIPVSGTDFAIFGGNTSCYLVEAGDEAPLRLFVESGDIVVDALGLGGDRI